MRVEVDQLDHGRVVGTANSIRLAPITWRDVIEYRYGHGRDAPFFRGAQLWPIGTIDQPDRQIEDQIDDPWPRDARNQLLELGADATKRARFSEQGKQNRRTHRGERIWAGEVVLNGAKALYPAHGK
jgi:hypothetical protein